MRLSELVDRAVVHEERPVAVPRAVHERAWSSLFSSMASVCVVGLFYLFTGPFARSPRPVVADTKTAFVVFVRDYLVGSVPWMLGAVAVLCAVQSFIAWRTKGFRVANVAGQYSVFLVSVSGPVSAFPWVLTVVVTVLWALVGGLFIDPYF